MTHAGLVKQEVLQSTFRASAGPRPLRQMEVGAFECLKGCVEIAEPTFKPLADTNMAEEPTLKKKHKSALRSKFDWNFFYLQPRKVDRRSSSAF